MISSDGEKNLGAGDCGVWAEIAEAVKNAAVTRERIYAAFSLASIFGMFTSITPSLTRTS